MGGHVLHSEEARREAREERDLVHYMCHEKYNYNN